jgi:hypothetical protein
LDSVKNKQDPILYMLARVIMPALLKRLEPWTFVKILKIISPKNFATKNGTFISKY